ncbi:MAG: resolvase [Chlamydiae bacterium]|nr:resolvase [Chlamydiota bacterium]
MKIFAYLRVSTEHQSESGAGLSAQEVACKKWAENQGKSLSGTFIEEGIGGATSLDKRPALLRAIDALSKGDILLVSRLDRLSRDLYGGIIIEEAVAHKKAKIASVAGEGTENEDPASIMIRQMIRVVAGFERNLIKLRTKSAMAAKKLRGERVGHIPFGFRLGQGKLLEPNPEEQAILVKIRELRMEGMSMREIAEQLNHRKIFNRGQRKWNHESIRNAMKKIAA